MGLLEVLTNPVRIMHQSFVTTTPEPPGNSGDFWLFVRKIPALSPTLRGQTVGKTTAICPCSLLCFTMCSCNPRYFRIKKQNPVTCLALWGWCKSKNPPHFHHPALGVGGRGYSWLVHKLIVKVVWTNFFSCFCTVFPAPRTPCRLGLWIQKIQVSISNHLHVPYLL